MRNVLTAVVLCGFYLCSIGNLFAADKEKTYRLIFSSFDVKSAKDYSYLRDSIQTMLMARLATKEKIEVVDRVLSREELAVLGQQDTRSAKEKIGDVDYLVTGGLYSLATGLNIQVSMYPVDSDGKVLNFSHLARTSADIISGTDQLIASVTRKLLGEEFTPPVENVVAGRTPGSGFTTVHPEEAYKRGLYTGTVIQTDLHGIAVEASGVKRKISVPGEMIGCVAGDLDGDGSIEIVGLTASKLTIYQTQERKIVAVDEMALPPGLRVHRINMADISGDGKPEIYLSATDGLYLSSRILEWAKDSGFITKAKNIRHYLRPVYMGGKGWLLVGQDRGTAKADFIRKGLFELELGENYEVIKKGLLPFPEEVDLFEFSVAELDGKPGDELVVLGSDEKLRVYSSENQLVWVSEGSYGGSKTYLGPSMGEAVDEQSKTGMSLREDEEREIIFVPARLLVTDVNNDGKSEIVVNENESGILGFFKRIRSYDGGTVTGLAWDGSGLSQAWRTGKYKGYIVDYAFKRLEPSQVQGTAIKDKPIASGLLYIANMPRSGSLVGLLPGVGGTEITIYDLDFYMQKQGDKK